MDDDGVAPRRIVLVVDRRVIVDQVTSRARQLRRALESPSSPATRAVAERLAEAVGDGAPLLEVAVLRGASLRDDAWARRPQVPVLAAGTVDQVGSRLFFRGYGVSHSMRPVHAGLMGCDTLLLLDEVHLARPFADVLTQLVSLRGEEGPVPRRFHVVELSATPGADVKDPFRLEAADLENPVLVRRVGAKKPVTLDSVQVKAKADEAEKRQCMAEKAAQHARAMIDEERRAVAVVVNRVDTARRAWQELEDDGFDRFLVTGRMRPLDQRALLDRIEDRVLAGRTDGPETRPLVLIATQCIEAGADFDFDGMVTECASLDALRQRFGRVDRRGGRNARGVVLVRSDQTRDSDDPVYGAALGRTWEWLEELKAGKAIDFGVDALQPHINALGTRIDELRAPHRDAPVLMSSYLDQWVQTNPIPHADPDISLFLHGIPEEDWSTAPDVQVVWRADITKADVDAAYQDEDARERLFERLEATPPGALEALSVPVWVARRWLTDANPDPSDEDVADVEGQRVVLEQRAREGAAAPVVVWRGRRRAEILEAHKLTPGALVIVPAERGGLGPHETFDPAWLTEEGKPLPVPDLGDAVQLLQRGRPSLRLDVRVIERWVGDEFKSSLDSADETSDVSARVRDAVDRILTAHVPKEPSWFSALRIALKKQEPRLRPVRLDPVRKDPDDASSWLVRGRPLSPKRLTELLANERTPSGTSPADTTTEGEDGSFIGTSSRLDAHLEGVGGMSAEFARASGLPKQLVAALRWAGRLHDIGKVDPRFQLWLYGGDEVAASVGEVLAKSALPWQDAAARRRARERAKYPPSQRHELVSLDMVEGSDALRGRVEAEDADWDLVLHLVASHHGWCRPVAPPIVIDEGIAEEVAWEIDGVSLTGTTNHERARMDRGVTDRFWRLVRRYGWHELAYLEAVMRLADHRRSATEQEGEA